MEIPAVARLRKHNGERAVHHRVERPRPGVELIEHPAIMTHASLPSETREALGIGDTLVRLSVGTEDVEDLIQDLKLALA
ncbi:MAG: PLP-dependent transferase [Chromatiales bacterium]